MMSFINDKDILYQRQHGLRQTTCQRHWHYWNLWTKLLLLLMNVNIHVFIGLNNAFDRNIHAQKHEHYGIRGIAYKWTCRYLRNRRQHVCINYTTSE